MSNKKNRTKEEGKLDPYIQLVALEHANEKIAELELLLAGAEVKLKGLELIISDMGALLSCSRGSYNERN